MNTTRPKSSIYKRENKHRSVARKIVIMEERKLAMKALSKGQKLPVKPVTETKKAAPAKATATKAPAKKAAEKKPAVKKPRATKKD